MPSKNDMSKNDNATRAEARSPVFQNDLLGQVLIGNNKITQKQMQDALSDQRKSGKMLGRILIDKHHIDEGELMLALQQQIFISNVSLKGRKIPPNVLALVPTKFAKAHRVVPFEKMRNLLCVAMANCLDDNAVSELKSTSKFKIKIYSCPWPEIKEALDNYYGEKRDLQRMLEVGESEKPLPVILPGKLEHSKEFVLTHVFLSSDVEGIISKIVIPEDILHDALSLLARKRRDRESRRDKLRVASDEDASTGKAAVHEEVSAVVPISDEVFTAMTTVSYALLEKRWNSMYASEGPLPVKRA